MPGILISDRTRIKDFAEASATRTSASAAEKAKSILKPLGSQIPTELLSKEAFNVCFIVNNKDEKIQDLPPASSCLMAVRGSDENSVNSPGFVATSMLPPCCFTTIS